MKTKKLRLPALLFAAILMAGMFSFTALQAQSIKHVTVKSSKNFDETLSAIKKAVSGGGMMVLSELNQGKVLSMTGLSINAHSFFVGNPTVGKEAFSSFRFVFTIYYKTLLLLPFSFFVTFFLLNIHTFVCIKNLTTATAL